MPKKTRKKKTKKRIKMPEINVTPQPQFTIGNITPTPTQLAAPGTENNIQETSQNIDIKPCNSCTINELSRQIKTNNITAIASIIVLIASFWGYKKGVVPAILSGILYGVFGISLIYSIAQNISLNSMLKELKEQTPIAS